VGLSDPNSLKPRDFKYHYKQMPVSQNAFEKLTALTTQTGSGYEVLKKNTHMNEYTAFGNKVNDKDKTSLMMRAHSQMNSQRKNIPA
jgi:hypothetical protein